MIEVRKAACYDAARLAVSVTDAARLELEALGFTPFVGLRTAMQDSLRAFAVYAGDTILAMAGVRIDGSVWMVVSKDAHRYRRSLFRWCRGSLEVLRQIEALRDQTIHTFVDSRNTVGLRWVRSLGFDILLPLDLGVGGVPLHRVELRR